MEFGGEGGAGRGEEGGVVVGRWGGLLENEEREEENIQDLWVGKWRVYL